MTVTFQAYHRAGRHERPCLSPPLVYRHEFERYCQRLAPGPRMPNPAGDGWEKVGGIRIDKTWTSWSTPNGQVWGPCKHRVQHWRRRRFIGKETQP